MKRYVEGEDRSQATLLPEYLEDYIAEDNPVQAWCGLTTRLRFARISEIFRDPWYRAYMRGRAAGTLH